MANSTFKSTLILNLALILISFLLLSSIVESRGPPGMKMILWAVPAVEVVVAPIGGFQLEGEDEGLLSNWSQRHEGRYPTKCSSWSLSWEANLRRVRRNNWWFIGS
ncbi:hypothetical protein ACFE04_013051 [Oxalis oulophora]